MSNRPLAPKPALTVQAVVVSQLTCLAILGVDPRRFIEDLVPRCDGVAKLGRLRLVPIDAALRALRELAPDDEASVAPASGANDVEDVQPETGEAFLALVRGGRRAG